MTQAVKFFVVVALQGEPWIETVPADGLGEALREAAAGAAQPAAISAAVLTSEGEVARRYVRQGEDVVEMK